MGLHVLARSTQLVESYGVSQRTRDAPTMWMHIREILEHERLKRKARGRSQ